LHRKLWRPDTHRIPSKDACHSKHPEERNGLSQQPSENYGVAKEGMKESVLTGTFIKAWVMAKPELFKKIPSQILM